MHFLIMDKYFNEDGFRVMKQYMVDNNIPHTSVKPLPFANIFVPEDIEDYSDATYEKYFDKSIPTMSFGSYALANQLVENGYTPGGFINDNFNIKLQMEKWGSENFLNGNCNFFKIGKVELPYWDNIFIRPVFDTKQLIAKVIERENFFYALREYYKNGGNDQLDILVSEAVEILSEYRLFIVNGKVVAQSLYKVRGQFCTNPVVPNIIIQKAEELCKIWTPAPAFVMDFAEDAEGFCVLEVNNINCAGFYACDIPSIVDALNG